MKIAVIIIRVLLGLVLLFSSISFFLKLGEQPVLTGDIKTVMEGYMATKYLLPLVKGVEFLSGLSFVSGKFTKLFCLVFLPVAVNILCTHIFLAPEGLPLALFVFSADLFLIYSNWDAYKGIFSN